MDLTRRPLVRVVRDLTGLNEITSKKAVRKILLLLKEALQRGEQIEIEGLGLFKIRGNDRAYWSPRRGKTIHLKKRIYFYPHHSILRSLNGNPD